MHQTEFVNRLNALNLEGIALTAAIDAQGNLEPVRSGFDKMLAAAQERSLPRLHTILSHPETGLPPHLDGPVDALRSLAARNLDEAISLLLNEQNTRWGAIPSYSDVFRQHRNLVGRGWLHRQVNQAIEDALADPAAPPYIVITGGPGTGKTAFVAGQVAPGRDRAAVYHFIRRGLGQDDPNIMLASLTAQLQRVHVLPSWNQDRSANRPAAFQEMIDRAANTLHEGERQVIWIDGLDEAFGPLGAYRGQPLHRLLPLDGLPPGIILVMTSRREDLLEWLGDEQRFKRIDLDENREASLADIREYLGYRNRDLNLGIEAGLLDRLAQASEGCFMAAVRYLNPAGDLAALQQRIADWRRRPSSIPTGLEGWLQRQWSVLIAAATEQHIERRVVYAAMGVAAHEAGLRTGAGHSASVTSAIKVAARFLTSTELGNLDETLESVTRLAGEFFEIRQAPDGQVWYQFFHTRFADFVREKVEQEAARVGQSPSPTAPPPARPSRPAETLSEPAGPPLLKKPVSQSVPPAPSAAATAPSPQAPPQPARPWQQPQTVALIMLAIIFLSAIGLALLQAIQPPARMETALPGATTSVLAATRAVTQEPTRFFTQTAPTITFPTPSPTLKDVFTLNACMSNQLSAANRVDECINAVTVLTDGRLRLDVTWNSFLQQNASVVIHPVEAGMMYLTDDLGNRYDPLSAGGSAAVKEILTGTRQISGWLIFPALAAGARELTFHDADNNIQTPAFPVQWAVIHFPTATSIISTTPTISATATTTPTARTNTGVMVAATSTRRPAAKPTVTDVYPPP